MKNNTFRFVVVVFFIVISACTNLNISHRTSDQAQQISYPKLNFIKTNEFIVLMTKDGDTLSTLAMKFLGDKNKAWVIADFNNINKISPNKEIVIPLINHNMIGVTTKGVQTIPVLCYHRFGNDHIKLSVSEEKFKRQMQYLKDNDFNVIPMQDLIDYLNNSQPLPKKSVVITIDDGYRSTYDTAFPILKSFNFPATLFLYTDFTGAKDAITWKQAKIMKESGLIEIQPHSKSHPNMSLKGIDETEAAYKKRITKEIKSPGQQITRHLGNFVHTFAYPYGDSNNMIIDLLKQENVKLGVSVEAGSNSAFSHPYMLQRTMIFGNHTIEDFRNFLVTFKNIKLKQ